MFHYREHFRTLEQGKRVAQLRAERFLCARKTFRGKTSCGRFRVGHRFSLVDYFDDDQNTGYLITRVTHTGEPASPGAPATYEASFEAVDAKLAYRPERQAKQPAIIGALYSLIEGDATTGEAKIDEEGRYLVKLPFVTGVGPSNEAYRWVRDRRFEGALAKPYA